MAAAKRFVSPIDASERTLSTGQVLVPGEETQITAEVMEDPHQQRLLEEGQLLEVTKTSKSSSNSE